MMTIIGSVTTLLSTWVSGLNAKSQAKQEMALAEMQNKARLLQDTESNNHDWEMANLTDKDKWLRRISFAMFASPFIVALFAPHFVNSYFTIAINSVPLWWQKTFMSITGGIWSIASLKNVIPSIVDTFRKQGS